MLGLDNITLLFLTGLAHALLAMMLFSVRRPSGNPAMSLYAASQLLFALALLLIYGRRFGESFWFISFPNMLLTLAFTLMAKATAQFLQWQHHHRILWFFVPVIVLQLVPREFGLDEHWRLLLVVILASLPQFLLSYVFLHFWRNASALQRFVTVSNVLLSACFLLRAFESATADSSYNFYHAGIGQELGLLAVFVNVLINGFGFLLVVNERTRSEMRRLSTLDPMTRVLNRQSFLASAMNLLTAADRDGHSISIAFCCLRQLKKVNTDAGEFRGDETIRHMVKAVQGALSERDLIGRWQGHQLMVLIDGKTVEETLILAQHVIADFTAFSKHKTVALSSPLHIVVTRYRSHEDFLSALQRVQQSLNEIAVDGDSQVLLNTV